LNEPFVYSAVADVDDVDDPFNPFARGKGFFSSQGNRDIRHARDYIEPPMTDRIRI